MQIALFSDMIIIFGLSLAVIYLFDRIRVPSIVGFIVTGMLVGPHGLRLIRAAENVEILAEVGIVALLFTIGLEFSLRNLLQIRKFALLGGSLQVGLTALAGMAIARLTGYSFGQSLFFGFLLSLSSTAIVMKIAQDRAEIDSPQGRSSLGILIFQDLIVVPMILVTPILGGTPPDVSVSTLYMVLKGLGAILIILAGAKWLVPALLHAAAGSRNREIFQLTVIIICLTVAWLTHAAGLSLALGAFLAGLIISESEYSHQTVGHILPFRDAFASFFFVSIGMLIDTAFLLEHPFLIIALVLGVLLLKTFLGGTAIAFQGLPLRTCIISGLFLCQIGEFSFILARTGAAYQLISGMTYQVFLAVSAVTMSLTPFIMAAAPRTARAILELPFPEKWKSGNASLKYPHPAKVKDHLLIVGFGLTGRNVAQASRKTGIPYLVLEANPDVVRREKKKGENILYGDATSEAVLRHAGLKEARAMVVAVNDAAATRRITANARRMNRKLHIIVRTRFILEMEPLHSLGADEVIPEEYETSVEIFCRVLRHYLIPRQEIERFVSESRSAGYEMFRSLSQEAVACSELRQCLPDMEIATYRLEEGAPASGKSLADLALRKAHDVTILAVRRGNDMIYNPEAETRLQGGDILMAFGTPDSVAAVAPLFTEEKPY